MAITEISYWFFNCKWIVEVEAAKAKSELEVVLNKYEKEHGKIIEGPSE